MMEYGICHQKYAETPILVSLFTDLGRYRPESASQAANGEITIKAERHSDGWITSARLESYQLWTTAYDSSIKNRGYLEVRSTIPARVRITCLTNSINELSIKAKWWKIQGLLASYLDAGEW